MCDADPPDCSSAEMLLSTRVFCDRAPGTRTTVESPEPVQSYPGLRSTPWPCSSQYDSGVRMISTIDRPVLPASLDSRASFAATERDHQSSFGPARLFRPESTVSHSVTQSSAKCFPV